MNKHFLEASSPSLKIKKEEQAVLQQYKNLKKAISQYTLTEEEHAKIDRAFQLAQASHKGIYRHSGEPYIMHPLRVAQIVVEELGLGLTGILCSLLHDVVEDTSVSN